MDGFGVPFEGLGRGEMFRSPRGEPMREDDRESCVSTGEAVPEVQGDLTFSNRGDDGKFIAVRVISEVE